MTKLEILAFPLQKHVQISVERAKRTILFALLTFLSWICCTGTQASALINGGSITGVIGVAHQQNSYSFTGNQNEHVILSVADTSDTGTTSGFFPLVTVYQPNGTYVSGGSGYVVGKVELTLPVSGNYTVIVQDSQVNRAGDQTGSYELFFVQAGANEHGVLINGGSRTETISLGDLDSYSFTGNANERVILSVADTADTGTTAGLYPRVAVYQPNGTPVDGGSGYSVGKVELTLPVSGTYSVIVQDSNINRAGDQTGSYELFFVQAGANEHGVLINGGSRTETISLGDLDSYSFTGNANERVILSVADTSDTGTTGGFFPLVTVYQPNGTYVSGGSGYVVGKDELILPVSGTYTVIVQDSHVNRAGDQTGSYELFFVQAGANEHGALVNGAIISHVINLGDLDSFTFTVPAGEKISLKATRTSGASFRPYMSVYRSNGSYQTGSESSSVANIAFTAAQADTYSVIVTDSFINRPGDQTGSYNLEFLTPDHPPVVLPPVGSSSQQVPLPPWSYVLFALMLGWITRITTSKVRGAKL